MREKIPRFLIFFFALLFVACFGFLPSQTVDLRSGKMLLTEWAAFFFIASFLKSPFLKTFLVWLVLRHVLGLVEISKLSLSTQELYYKWFYVEMNTIFLYLILFEFLARALKKEHTNMVLNGIGVLALLQCLFVFLQNWGVWIFVQPMERVAVIKSFFNGWLVIANPTEIYGNPRAFLTGMLDNPNVTSSMLALSTPCFLRRKWAWGLPFLFWALLLVNSLTGLVVCLFVLGCYAWVRLSGRLRVLLAILIFLCLACYAAWFETPGSILGSGRLKAWEEVYQTFIQRKWLIGWGAGQSKLLYPALQTKKFIETEDFKQAMVKLDEYKTTQEFKDKLAADKDYEKSEEFRRLIPKIWLYRQLHNDWLQLWLEHGLIGLVCIAGFMAQMVFCGLRRREYLPAFGALAAMVYSVPHFLFHTTVALIPMTYLALLYWGGEYQNTPQQS